MRKHSGARGTGHGAVDFRDLPAPRPPPPAPMLIFLLFLGGITAYAETVNRIVAIVNEDVITEADVSAHASALLADQSLPESSDADTLEMERVALRRLIEQRLILQEAKRAQITAGAEEVLSRLDTVRGRFESEEAFETSLASAGMTKERLKESLREQLMVQRLIDTKVRAGIVISPQEVARELAAHPELARGGDRVRASHILVRVGEAPSEEPARRRIEDLRQQLVRGGDFAALAKQYSEDPHAPDGGAMDWVAQGELMPELDAVLFQLKPGEISQPIQTRLGFHLVRVEERRAADQLAPEHAQSAVYQRLYEQKFQQAFTRWLTQLKERAYISILTNP